MSSRFVSGLFIGVLSATLAGGCVTRFQPPQATQPHATLALPSLGTASSTGMVVEPVEINGLARPQHWTGEGIRVPPGNLQLTLRAAADNLHGTCSLSFAAIQGETYELGAGHLDETFIIQVSHDGAVLAECVAARTLSPTPLRLRGVIPDR